MGFVPGNNQGGPLQVHRQNLEQEMRIGLARFVVDAVADIAGLEKEIARAVDHGLVGQDVCHFTCHHLAYAWPQVIVDRAS
jgi:hypothetical protein